MLVGRALILTGIIWMLLTGVLSFFLAGFGDCFDEESQFCRDFHTQAGRIADLLPYLALLGLTIALLAIKFRAAAVLLLAIAIALLLFGFAPYPAFELPFVRIEAHRLRLSLFPQLVTAALWLLGSLLILWAGRRQPRPSPAVED